MFEDRLKKALSQRKDLPARVPRFATARPAAATLPRSLDACLDRVGRPPFSLVWKDDTLGVRVEVRESPDGDVWAHAGGSPARDLGAAEVVVVLGGKGGERRKERVTLGPTAAGRMEGSVNLGPLAGLLDSFGPEIEVSAFLRAAETGERPPG